MNLANIDIIRLNTLIENKLKSLNTDFVDNSITEEYYMEEKRKLEVLQGKLLKG